MNPRSTPVPRIAFTHLSFACVPRTGPGPRLVFHLSRRYFNAVQRNRIKRKIRELTRRNPEAMRHTIRVYVLKKFNPHRESVLDVEINALLNRLAESLI
ncbi:MAG: ribonuclease P protein component [Fibrobacterota bacterium]